MRRTALAERGGETTRRARRGRWHGAARRAAAVSAGCDFQTASMSGLEAGVRRTCRRACARSVQSSATEEVNAHSASSIQNSARCRAVCERSARKAGARVYTRLSELARASRCSCAETVRCADWEKNSMGVGEEGDATGARRKVSPAPSASREVRMGVWQ